jgi:hypothetical protein
MHVKAGEIEKYKSLFTINFIRYIGWPEESKQGDFVIGVVKDSKLAKELISQTTGKKFGFQNIVVKEYNNVNEVADCQILYISTAAGFSRNAATVESKVGKNTLIISEDNGAISKGSIINFVIVDNLLKFEVSPSNAKNNGLTLSSALVSMKNAIRM